MKTTIKYLPKGTTQDEIKKIRKEFNKEEQLILIISGEEDILENLCEFIKYR